MEADVQWFKILSWHVFTTFTRGNTLKARCGRVSTIGAQPVDSRPGNEKTCETCLKLVGPR